MTDLPGGAISSRPLRFFWVLDVSSSMAGDKIDQLNFAMREALPALKSTADDNTNAAVEMMVLTFGTATNWITPAPVPLDQFTWTNIGASGITSMGAAMREVAKQLGTDKMPDRGLPPVVVLITDGQPTDDFDAGLREFMAQPWAKRAVRIAIAIGSDADLGPLRAFIAHKELEPLVAREADTLHKYIRWVSTQVLKSATAPNSLPTGTAQTGVTAQSLVPTPPAPDPNATPTDVW